MMKRRSRRTAVLAAAAARVTAAARVGHARKVHASPAGTTVIAIVIVAAAVAVAGGVGAVIEDTVAVGGAVIAVGATKTKRQWLPDSTVTVTQNGCEHTQRYRMCCATPH